MNCKLQRFRPSPPNGVERGARVQAGAAKNGDWLIAGVRTVVRVLDECGTEARVPARGRWKRFGRLRDASH